MLLSRCRRYIEDQLGKGCGNLIAQVQRIENRPFLPLLLGFIKFGFEDGFVAFGGRSEGAYSLGKKIGKTSGLFFVLFVRLEDHRVGTVRDVIDIVYSFLEDPFDVYEQFESRTLR